MKLLRPHECHRSPIPGLLALVLLGLALRLAMGRESLWLDEMTAIEIAEKDFPHLLQSLRVSQHAPPLDYLILHFVSRLTQWDPAYWVPSLVWGILAIPLFRSAVGRWFDTGAAWWGAFLLCISALPIRYSLEARMYSLWLMGTIGSWWALGRLASGFYPFRLVQWGAWALLVLFTHTFGLPVVLWEMFYLVLLVMFPQAFALHETVRQVPPFRRIILGFTTVLIVCALYIPELQILISRAQADFTSEQQFSLNQLTPRYVWNEILSPLGPSIGRFSPLILVAALYGFGLHFSGKPLVGLWLLGWFLVLPAAILVGLDKQKTFLASRYFIFLCPVYLAWAAVGLQEITLRITEVVRRSAGVPKKPDTLRRALSTALAGFLLAAVLPSLKPPKNDLWYPLLKPALEDTSPGSILLVADDRSNLPYVDLQVSFYFRNHPLGKRLLPVPETDDLLEGDLRRCRRAWLVRLSGAELPQNIERIIRRSFRFVHRKGGHELLKYENPSSKGESWAQDRVVPGDRYISAGLEFGENLILEGYSWSPTVVRPGEWVVLSSWWTCKKPPAADWAVKVDVESVRKMGDRVTRFQMDHFPFGGAHRFPDWEAGKVYNDRWVVRVPADFIEGPSRLKVRLVRQARLGSHHRDIPFYEWRYLTEPDGGAERALEGYGPEVRKDGLCPEKQRGLYGPTVSANLEFREGGCWKGIRIDRSGGIVVYWEGTSRRPPPRDFLIGFGDPVTGQGIAHRIPSVLFGHPPAVLREDEQVGYDLPVTVPVEFRENDFLFFLATLDPDSGKKIEEFQILVSRQTRLKNTR